jgi:hypothetical protein
VLVTVPASEIAALREVPLDEEIEVLNCRTGNHVPFHFFQLKHCQPDSAAFIIFQNDFSWRLACSLRTFFFLVFIGISPPFRIMWPGIYDSAKGFSFGKANHAGGRWLDQHHSMEEAADGEDREMVAKNDAAERKGDETLRATLK